MPAMVKREVADSREADEDGAEDTTRLQYRGFDKSKLNATRKHKRKEARVSKKQHKAEHQASDGPRAAAAAARGACAGGAADRARARCWGALVRARAACRTTERARPAAVECVSRSSADPAVLRASVCSGSVQQRMTS